MGFSPKVLAVLIALGLVATGSIIFNVYLLATRYKALDPFWTELKDLKEKAATLENELGTLKAGNDQPNNKPKSGDGPTALQKRVTELEASEFNLILDLVDIEYQNKKLEKNKAELENKLKEIIT